MKTKIYRLTSCALMCAVLCALGPLSVPLPGGVPVSLQTLGVLLCGALLPPVYAAACAAAYVALGTAGLPVFSGFSGGMAKLAGYTGGFILSFIPMAALCSLLIRALRRARAPSALRYSASFASAALLNYAAGTLWFMAVSGLGFAASLAVCAAPFALFDAVKIAFLSAVLTISEKRLSTFRIC